MAWRILEEKGCSTVFGLLLVLLYVVTTADLSAQQPLVFKDVGRERGLFPALDKVKGHGAGWGDVNGDGWPDLYVGTFHYQDTKPNQLLLNDKGSFRLDGQQSVRISSRTTGVIFVDLDNDQDLDLYVGSMPAAAGSRLATRLGYPLRGCTLFENDGKGNFKDISQTSGACPPAFGGRSVTTLDIDGDGLLDLLVGEDPITGYNGSKTRTSRLFRNLGNMKFRDVTTESGIPSDAAGLGVAAGDLNRDGFPDLFLASTIGNFLMLNDGKGKFSEPVGIRKVFAWENAKGDDMVCGVALADVNNDGWTDVLIGQHFSSPWVKPVRNRLYLNRGLQDSGQSRIPKFEDVSDQAGLVPLPLKAPHVEIQDFDNDGFADIFCSIVKWKNGKPFPLIFRNLGRTDKGIPRFEQQALQVNDFPTDEDRQIKRSGKFFDKMIADKKIIYTAAAPTCDFDRDGKLDLFFANWWPESPSMLLRNESESGNWIDVTVRGVSEINWMGIGTRVEVFEAGHIGSNKKRIGSREIATGFGYASSQQAIAHFGLGDRDRCDILVTLPNGKGKLIRRGVKANQRINIAK